MPIIINDTENIVLKIELVKNEYFDYQNEREDNLNWIPFEFELNICNEVVMYSPDVIKTFSLVELRYFIKKLKNVCIEKKNSTNDNISFVFMNREHHFEIKIYDSKEDNFLYLDIWINMGDLTNGKIYGFSKGYRFIAFVDQIMNFAIVLEKQLENLLKNV